MLHVWTFLFRCTEAFYKRLTIHISFKHVTYTSMLKKAETHSIYIYQASNQTIHMQENNTYLIYNLHINIYEVLTSGIFYIIIIHTHVTWLPITWPMAVGCTNNCVPLLFICNKNSVPIIISESIKRNFKCNEKFIILVY